MPKFVSKEQVRVIADTLAEFNFFRSSNAEAERRDREYFEGQLNKKSAYFGSTFEYTNRPSGVRLLAILAPDGKSLRSVFISRDHESAAFSQEQVNAANEKMMSVIY
jgi:hypothetical protein